MKAFLFYIDPYILSEEGYYPFGMTMSAISSTAGTELNETFDINYYETYFRQYDAQLGRFTGVDALAEQTFSWSTYQFGYNNPVVFNDPSGLQADGKEGQYWGFWLQILGYIGHPDYPYGLSFKNSGDGTFEGKSHESEPDAFLDGIKFIERTDGWGKAGVKFRSYEEALNAFSSKFGYLPPITVKAHNERDIYGQSWLVVHNWDDVYKQLERNGFRHSDLDNFWSNLGWAVRMTAEWTFWVGPQQRTFNNDDIARALMDSRVVGEGRDFWYNEVNAGHKSIIDGVTNFKGKSRIGGGNFGFTGLMHAGLDPIEQFMGSTSQFTINSDGETLTYIITNTTSFKSLMYGLTPSFLNFYNTTQTYIFTEPINLNRIHP